MYCTTYIKYVPYYFIYMQVYVNKRKEHTKYYFVLMFIISI